MGSEMLASSSILLPRLPRTVAATATVLGIAVVGGFDFLTGAELRVFPLYYLPLSFAAWQFGRSWALAASVLCAISWLFSNYLAGLTFSGPGVWVFNVSMQSISFAAVGLLLAALRAALDRERELSRRDPLTSLSNARAFYEEAARVLALSRRKGHPVSLAYIDLDDFKAINDTLGHQRGDEVLRSVATLVSKWTRISDLTARVGGDEFVVLLPETGPEQARVMLERLRAMLGETLSRNPCPATASIGAVAFLRAPESVDTMVQVADSLMYAAKAAGKNQVHLDVVGDRLTEPCEARREQP